jgi:hypothetical protein
MNNIILVFIAILAIIILKYIESTPHIWLLASDIGNSWEFKRGKDIAIGNPGSIGL